MSNLSVCLSAFIALRVHATRASGGSGLGLAICLNIVEAHGGAIHAAHSPFGGVSITVELPLEREKSRDV